MFRSIRGRLQLWHAAILLVVLLSFGAMLFAQMRHDQLHEIDAELMRVAESFPPPGRGHRPPRDFRSDDHHREPPLRNDFPPQRDFSGEEEERDEPREVLPSWFAEQYADTSPPPYFAVWGRDGRLLGSANLPPGTSVPQMGSSIEDGPPAPQFTTRGTCRELVREGPGQSRILVGRSLEPELRESRHLIGLLLVTGGVVLAVGLAGGWIISRQAMRPLVAMSATAEAISASNLSERIDVGHTDTELSRLAQVLNATFARLEEAFQRQNRFTADASHELRTPVSVILADTESALAGTRSEEELRETVETCYRAANRMRDLVNALMTLTRIDAGQTVHQPERFDLSRVAEECADLVRPLASQHEVTLELDLSPAEITGVAGQFSQVILNLLTNAIHYNRPGGLVRLAVAQDDAATTLTVADTGVGISAEDQEHVFERFYRVDKARSRRLGGSGLGLSICQSIVEAHGGRITVRSEVGQGTRFAVRLPRDQ